MNKPAITALITIQEQSSYYLPDAHFKEFGGKPLFQLMIEKLSAISSIQRIVVTTDSDTVRNMCSSNSKISLIALPDEAVFSSEQNAQILERMPTSDIFTAHSLGKTEGEHFLQTQCINPLLTDKQLKTPLRCIIPMW